MTIYDLFCLYLSEGFLLYVLYSFIITSTIQLNSTQLNLHYSNCQTAVKVTMYI